MAYLISCTIPAVFTSTCCWKRVVFVSDSVKDWLKSIIVRLVATRDKNTKKYSLCPAVDERILNHVVFMSVNFIQKDDQLQVIVWFPLV